MSPLLGEIAFNPGWIAFWGEQLFRASWQGALLAAFVAVLCRALPRLPANARCMLWWLVCLKMLICLVCTAPIIRVPLLPASNSVESISVDSRALLGSKKSAPESIGGRSITPPSASSPVVRRQSVEVADSAPWLLTTFLIAGLLSIWVVGACVRLSIGLIPLRRVQSLLSSATVVNDPSVQSMMKEISTRLGLRHAPCLLLTEVETEPLAVSHWQNIVLLSRADFERLTPEELQAVLAHELAHIRRADLWLGLVPFAAQSVFWFHPFVWLACSEFSVSCEAACDAAALRALQTPTQAYGELLLKLGTRHISLGPAIALGATSQFRILQRRIIMMHQTPRCSRPLLVTGLTALFVPVVALGLIPWQLVASAHAAPVSSDGHEVAKTSGGAVRQQADAAKEDDKPVNLDFSQGMSGWRYDWADGSESYFDHGIDPKVRHNGQASPYLYATANLPHIYGVISQWIDAESYHGKRMRLTAYIKTQGVKETAGPMFGLVGGAHARNYIMKNQPIKGDTDWKRYEYVADVDEDTESLVLGMNLAGKGKVWMNHLTFEEVGKSVPLTSEKLIFRAESEEKKPSRPVNMDFSKGLDGWSKVEEGKAGVPSAYQATLDRKQAQRGASAAPALLTSDGSQPNGYGTLVQYIDPAVYAGKRIRLKGLVKTTGVNKYAGLWIGANGTASWTVCDATHSKTPAPADWTNVSLVMDAPKDCAALGLGVMIRGLGKIWVKSLTFEVVGDSVPVSPITLHVDGSK